MRILFIEEVFYPEIGGVCNHIVNLAQRLQPLGVECTLLTYLKDPSWQESEEYRGITIHRLPTLMASARFLRDHRYDYDLIHAHTSRRPKTSVLMILARRLGYPLLFTPHAYYPPRNTRYSILMKAFDLTLGRWAIRSTDRVINLTSVDREDGMARGQRQKQSVIIPNAIDYEAVVTNHSPVDFADKYGIGPFVLNVGRLDQIKNNGWLLRALVSVPDEYKLVLIGPDGGDKQRLQTLARELNIFDRVIWAGKVDHDDLIAAYKGCQAFVFPSRHEGLPTAVLEAMALGKIVIASQSGGTRDLVQDGITGFTLDLDHPASLMDVLKSLDDKALIKKITGNARQLVKDRYTWQVCADQVYELYKEVIDEKKCGMNYASRP